MASLGSCGIVQSKAVSQPRDIARINTYGILENVVNTLVLCLSDKN